MSKLYVEKLQAHIRTFQSVCPWQRKQVIQYNCAKYLIFPCALLHNAEFVFPAKNLLLIGKVFSYLTTILPNMGNRAGGECD